jgi:hypothetical protein
MSTRPGEIRVFEVTMRGSGLAIDGSPAEKSRSYVRVSPSGLDMDRFGVRVARLSLEASGPGVRIAHSYLITCPLTAC